MIIKHRNTDIEIDIEKNYENIKEYYTTWLSKYGVILPNLYRGKDYAQGATVLTLLADGYPHTKIWSKSDAEKAVSIITKQQIHDVQDLRHLSTQKGWYIQRNVDNKELGVGEYKLFSLELPHPNFKIEKREVAVSEADFENIKKEYNYCCATCGSKEGELHKKYPANIVKLEKGHMDPNQSLTGNIIPMCHECNILYKDNYIFDNRGNISKINHAKLKHHVSTIKKQFTNKDLLLVLENIIAEIKNEN